MSKIVLKKSSVAGKVPQIDDLDYGEFAINYNDGKLFYKKSTGAIDFFASSSASISGVSSIDGLTGDITSSQLLISLKKVDGVGSGLDADTLDGKHYQNIIDDAMAMSIVFGS